jgi:hypothetical protein
MLLESWPKLIDAVLHLPAGDEDALTAHRMASR